MDNAVFAKWINDAFVLVSSVRGVTGARSSSTDGQHDKTTATRWCPGRGLLPGVVQIEPLDLLANAMPEVGAAW